MKPNFMIVKGVGPVARINGLGPCFDAIGATRQEFPSPCSERTIRFLKQTGTGALPWKEKWARACGAAFTKIAQERADNLPQAVRSAGKQEQHST